MSNLFKVGTITPLIAKHVGLAEGMPIMQSVGLRGHIYKRHPECMPYVKHIPEIISSPDYIGHKSGQQEEFELVKTIGQNIQIAIKIDTSGSYFYVATLHIIAPSKIARQINSNRLRSV